MTLGNKEENNKGKKDIINGRSPKRMETMVRI